MPYIIDTREVAAPPNQDHGVRAAVLSSRAVATLDEARWAVAEHIGNANIAAEGMGAPGAFTPAERAEADAAIGEDGGYVRCADDTVIEAHRVSGYALAQRVAAMGLDPRSSDADKLVRILAAYNAGSRRR